MTSIEPRLEADYIPPQDWIWLPHAAHYCAANQCRFRMATVVGDFIVSTVGEYYPLDSKEKGWIGVDRLYETMVFLKREDSDECPVCHWVIVGDSLDMDGYISGESARDGHMRMCHEYAKLRVKR